MEQKNVIKRLSDYIEYDALTNPSDFAKGANVDVSGFSKMLKGKQTITVNTLKKIANAYGLNLKWLMEGAGEVHAPGGKAADFEQSQNDGVIGRFNGLKTELPVVKSHNCGVPYYNVDFAMGFDLLGNDQTVNPDYLIDCPPYNKCDLWCNAHGDSMSPTIANGDTVALKRIEDFSYLVNGEIYALVTSNGLRTIKRVNDNGDTLTLIPDNKEFETQTLPKKIFVHVFLVKGAMKIF